MSIERFVAFILTPLLSAAAGWLSGAVAKYGLHLDPTGIVTLTTTGAVGTVTAIVKWLNGRQSPELLSLEAAARKAETTVTGADPALASEMKAFIQAEIGKLSAKIESEDPQVDTSHLEVSTVTPVLAGDQGKLGGGGQ